MLAAVHLGWRIHGVIIELDRAERFLAPSANPGTSPAKWPELDFLAIGPNQAIYGADVLNWRFQVFARTAPTGNVTKYIPSGRMLWGSVPSVGWSSKQTEIPYK